MIKNLYLGLNSVFKLCLLQIISSVTPSTLLLCYIDNISVVSCLSFHIQLVLFCPRVDSEVYQSAGVGSVDWNRSEDALYLRCGPRPGGRYKGLSIRRGGIHASRLRYAIVQHLIALGGGRNILVCLLLCAEFHMEQNNIIGLPQVLWLEVQTSVRWLISRSLWGRRALRVLWWLWTGAQQLQDDTNMLCYSLCRSSDLSSLLLFLESSLDQQDSMEMPLVGFFSF